MFSIKRSKNNPIIKPNPDHEWESYATFNCCPIKVGKTTHILYRALSAPKKFESTNFSLSTIGKDGKQFIFPVEPWERYGCEDPRVSYIDGMYYIFYTALSLFPFRGDGIKVAVAVSKDLKTIKERHLVTPFNAKAMSLFPEKINGKYTVVFAANTDDGSLAKVSIAQFKKITDIWDHDKWNEWYGERDKWSINIPRGDNEQVEVGAPPIKTDYGWLLVYSHIKNYFSENKIFGIGALLLDFKDPQKIIAQTKTPFMVPETDYEKSGILSNIIFPSGVTLNGDNLEIFYGGADTICASASMSLSSLLASMDFVKKQNAPDSVFTYRKSHKFSRLSQGAMLEPRADHPWESRAVFNPATIMIDNVVYILYRAMSEDNTSVIGCAESYDMISVKLRAVQPVYTPRASFEEKRIPNGNSGCEDPRLTLIEDRIYMTYTAYNGVDAPAIALTSIDIKDFKAGVWKWDKPILVSKSGVDDKDGALFPKKIKNKYALIHRVNHAITVDYSDTLQFKNRENFVNNIILAPRPGMWDSRKVGVAMSPILFKEGWLLIYHGIGEDGVYRVGAALLDRLNIEKVLGRTAYPIFEPETEYEKHGQINEVVFPCGAIVKDESIYIYYGQADSTIGVATIKIKNILKTLL